MSQSSTLFVASHGSTQTMLDSSTSSCKARKACQEGWNDSLPRQCSRTMAEMNLAIMRWETSSKTQTAAP